MTDPQPGMRVLGAGGRAIGRVDAVFADYLLVRSGWLLPVDLYLPRTEVASDGDRLRVDVSRRAAYERWHRPLKQAPHP